MLFGGNKYQGKFIHYLNECKTLVLRVLGIGLANILPLCIINVRCLRDTDASLSLTLQCINNFTVHRLIFKFLGLIFLQYKLLSCDSSQACLMPKYMCLSLLSPV